jgi:hypothetical protein
MNARFAPLPILFVLSLVLAGCERVASTAEATRSAVVRDSAGVRIVEIDERAWADAPRWALGSEPFLSIGLVDGPEAYQFDRVTAALRLEDGTVVVANGGSREIRFYDRAGKHFRSVGRSGAGPGEYGFPVLLTRYPGDSLLVWDSDHVRGTLLDREGVFGRTIPRPQGNGYPVVRGDFGDGSLLASLEPRFLPSQEPRGWLRRDATFIRFRTDGQVDTLGQFFAWEMYVRDGIAYAHVPGARAAVAAASGGLLHHGSSDRYEICTYDTSGSLVRIVRSARATPLTEREIDAAIATRANRLPERAASIRATFNDIEYPSTAPAYAAFEVDAEGNLWVADYDPAGRTTEQGWTIHGRDGTLVGRLIAPPGLTIHEIGVDYVLGSKPDEFDVQHVVLYALRRPSRSGVGATTESSGRR